MSKKPNNQAEGASNPNLMQELNSIVGVLDQMSERGHGDEIERPLEALKAAAEEMKQAWSGSCLGYHANVYYRNLVPPPPGEHFSPEWGIQPRAFVTGTTGDWLEHALEDITATIYQRAGNPDLEPARAWELEARNVFLKSQRDLASILEIMATDSGSTALEGLQEETDKLTAFTPNETARRLMPQQVNASRDSLAVFQGPHVPPHISAVSEVYAIQNTLGITHLLADIARQASAHISRQGFQTQYGNIVGTRVFIGHGHSMVWRELKDFIENQLGLPVDEFNRIQSAGVSMTDRLSEMMDSATVAFLVMTGEDEQPSGELRPRENVVHEAGLFQGRKGFKRAIVLLEDGCSKFSNNAGLVHINFPKANIRAAFQDVREVLEREGILSKGVGS